MSVTCEEASVRLSFFFFFCECRNQKCWNQRGRCRSLAGSCFPVFLSLSLLRLWGSVFFCCGHNKTTDGTGSRRKQKKKRRKRSSSDNHAGIILISSVTNLRELLFPPLFVFAFFFFACVLLFLFLSYRGTLHAVYYTRNNNYVWSPGSKARKEK